MPEPRQRTDRPGRFGEVRNLVAWNDRRQDLNKRGYPPVGEWMVRTGTAQYPDYAHPDSNGGSVAGRGHLLTPDEADEYAEYLRRAAAWARAQNRVCAPDEEQP